MDNILQLQEKTLVDLRIIAKHLGIKKVESYRKEELIHKILDEQAIQSVDADALDETPNNGISEEKSPIQDSGNVKEPENDGYRQNSSMEIGRAHV